MLLQPQKVQSQHDKFSVALGSLLLGAEEAEKTG